MATAMLDISWLPVSAVRQRLELAGEDPAFWRRLLVITASLMRDKTCGGIPLNSNHQPLDFIHTVIEKLLSGGRKIPATESDATFLHFLTSCVESEINNTVTKKASRLTVHGDLSFDGLMGVSPVDSLDRKVLDDEYREKVLALLSKRTAACMHLPS